MITNKEIDNFINRLAADRSTVSDIDNKSAAYAAAIGALARLMVITKESQNAIPAALTKLHRIQSPEPAFPEKRLIEMDDDELRNACS